jgi:hypothetical protein
LIEVRNLPRYHIQSSGGRAGHGGITKFASAINSFQIDRPKTFASLRDIIIVADCDETPQENFNNVCRQIEKIFGTGTAPPSPLKRTLKTRPSVSVLMIPWTGEKGHLEKLCNPSTRNANKTVGVHIDTFMSLICAENWQNDSRFGKAWLRINLASRCESDPFVALGHVFEERKHSSLIPLDDSSFDRIANFLASFG